MLDMLAFNSTLDGFIKTYYNFTGFRELMNRQDVGVQMVDKFTHTLPQSIEAINNDIDKGYFTFRLAALELMLCHDPVLNRINSNQQVQLIRDMISKSKAKANSVEFGSFGQLTLAYALAKVLDSQKLFPDRNDQLKTFIDNMVVLDQAVIPNVFSVADQVSNH